MDEFITPKQNAHPSTPNAPNHNYISRQEDCQLDHARFSLPSPSIPAQATEHYGDLKSLVDSSEPDYLPTCTYLGPPIGYSAKIIEHTSPVGITTTSVYGSLMAPRPRLFTQCNDRMCLSCRPVLVNDHPSSGSTTPTPRSLQPREVASPRSSPKLDMQKVLRALEMNLE